MSETLVYRPKAEKKKIHSRDEFELCYMRHQYLRRTSSNPTEDEMKPYKSITEHFAKNTYYTYRNLFLLIGFDDKDLISIANIHLVSFLGLFSLEKNKEKYQEFVDTFHNINSVDPKEFDIKEKNKANYTMFLKQRMEDVVRVCRQKARNIKGIPVEEYNFYYGPKRPPKFLKNLVENHERYGFKKLDVGVYKSIKKKVQKVEGSIFRFDNNYYVSVPIDRKTLSLTDFCGADMNPYDNIHNMNPEELFSLSEDTDTWKERNNSFKRKNKRIKAVIIKEFIDKNKNSLEFKDEIKTAKKMLKSMGV